VLSSRIVVRAERRKLGVLLLKGLEKFVGVKSKILRKLTARFLLKSQNLDETNAKGFFIDLEVLFPTPVS
jgi:hypothetical protein